MGGIKLMLTIAILAALVPAALTRKGSRGGAKKWALRTVPLMYFNGEGVDMKSFTDIKHEARELFGRVLNMNRTVEVTGHIWMFPNQAQYYHKIVQAEKRGSTLCEVGFGSGLSSLGYLRSNPDIKLLTFDLWDDTMGRFGFDPVMHKRKELAADYLKSQFGDRWTLVKGDSYRTIPQYFLDNPSVMCDIIHVDGNHTRGGVLTDLVFFQTRAKRQHQVLIDDLQFVDVQNALLDAWKTIGFANCYKTLHRDLSFVGRKTNKHASKYWCRLMYNTSFEPDAEFKQNFLKVSGLPLPVPMDNGNLIRFTEPAQQIYPTPSPDTRSRIEVGHEFSTLGAEDAISVSEGLRYISVLALIGCTMLGFAHYQKKNACGNR
eukprot:TRINITY_DN21573_c0_g1_i1.p1 TRINITY_DN21573_c0_g1~~TRINITY_DN21573_c0_g1_i1.p1  ORF type:complete len:389 (+),score=60.88 TRINITY_DN21573_c0_g1_i1:44-1168(+)